MKLMTFPTTVKPEDIYDGDTIENVSVLIYPLDQLTKSKVKDDHQLWPNVLLTKQGIVAKFNLRLAGIDTPEMHPHDKYEDGTERTPQSIATEKKLAKAAKQALIDFLAKYNNEIYIADPDDGKYAGRIVCRTFVKDDNGKLRSVSNYMLVNNYARPYWGGRKSKWA